MSENDRLLRAQRGHIRVNQVERTQIQVRETGRPVTLRDEYHSRTNHYIKQSRPYFPNTKLRIYICCPYFLRVSWWLWIVSLSGCLGVFVGGSPSKQFPIVYFVACTIFFFIYCQHQWVNQSSLPVVLRQPVFNGQARTNWFYEVTITELKGVALENYRAGVGFVKMTQGKIKIQAFNERAVQDMQRARCHSRVLLVLFFLTSAYNLAFALLANPEFL